MQFRRALDNGLIRHLLRWKPGELVNGAVCQAGGEESVALLGKSRMARLMDCPDQPSAPATTRAEYTVGPLLASGVGVWQPAQRWTLRGPRPVV
jgi:hypothetical protein